MAHVTLVGEGAAGAKHRTHLRRISNGVLCVLSVHAFLAQPYVELLHLAHELLVLGKEERQLQLVERQRDVGPDDVRAYIICIVLGHETRGHVDAHHLGGRAVDVFHQRGEATGKGLAQPRAKETIDHQHSFFQAGRVELLRHLGEQLPSAPVPQTLLVLSTVGREMIRDVEQERVDGIARLAKQTRHGEGIAAVVARTGKHHDGHRRRPPTGDGIDNGTRRTLHKVYRLYRLVFNGELVQLLYLRTSKNLHSHSLSFPPHCGSSQN